MAGDQGNWGPAILALTIAFLVVVLIILFLRIVTRVWIVHQFWWDDAAIILAVLGTTIGAGLDFVEVNYGFGKHQQFLTPHNLQEFRKYTYGEWIQTFATLMWTKVSICLFLMRLHNSKTLLLPLQCAVAFLLFSNTILTVIWIMQCQPIHAAWDNSGTCMSREAKEGIILAQAVISVVSDFTFAAFPILFLWRVQIDLKTKIGLWVLMLPLDGTYDGIINWLWRLFEVQIGIIAACIPTLRPLYLWVMRRVGGDTQGLDTNIKFPLTNDPQSWVENVGDGKENGSDTAMNELDHDHDHDHIHGHGHQRKNTMTDDLIREGILVSEPMDTGVRRDSAHPGEASEDPRLENEMHKYGIDEC
ncbi:MAG: hypothetical protein ASARMPRED_005361 [Alectoria sarmentosa]|nr:MAG: hypothetical protein ASARMPRED_005361 [Alectoria sarmentosa]